MPSKFVKSNHDYVLHVNMTFFCAGTIMGKLQDVCQVDRELGVETECL